MKKIIKLYILECISAFIIFFGLDFVIEGNLDILGNIKLALVMAVIGTLIVKLVGNKKSPEATNK